VATPKTRYFGQFDFSILGVATFFQFWREHFPPFFDRTTMASGTEFLVRPARWAQLSVTRFTECQVQKEDDDGHAGRADESQLHRCSFLCKQASHHAACRQTWLPVAATRPYNIWSIILSCHNMNLLIYSSTHLHIYKTTQLLIYKSTCHSSRAAYRRTWPPWQPLDPVGPYTELSRHQASCR